MERVLIVDDNPDIREVLGTYAAKEGFEPITAKDGFEALDLFRKTSPAVILLDVMMPGMDRIPCLRKDPFRVGCTDHSDHSQRGRL